MKLNNERLLVIAPHADDEVLGCYGLINKIKNDGGSVFVQILTIGGHRKIEGHTIKKEDYKKECENVMKFLKIDDYDISYYEDQIKHLDTIEQSNLIEILESKSKVAISKIKPTIIAIPTIFSSHQDHVQAYKISMTALRPHPQKTRHMPNLVISYESPEYYFWSASSEFGRFFPDFYITLTKTEVDGKIEALSMYKTQMRKGQRDGESLTALARIRGSEVGLDYAEAYHIHRLFI